MHKIRARLLKVIFSKNYQIIFLRAARILARKIALINLLTRNAYIEISIWNSSGIYNIDGVK